MLPLMVALALAQQSVVNISTMDLPNPVGGHPRTEILWRPEDRLEPPKLSPKEFGVGSLKQHWEFDFASLGYAFFPSKAGMSRRARFFVYEQERKQKNDMALAVTRMLLRLWEHLYNDLNMDNPARADRQCVDVYLCWAGPPGGEQLTDTDADVRAEQNFEPDPQLKSPLLVNTIYIYDIPSFTDPVEMAREVAHEYGHASMPAVGGFKKPEEWGNGYFGEKLYLLYMRDQLMAGKLTPDDCMGATGPELDAWLKKNVDPLVATAASGPPDMASLGSVGPRGMNAYMGLVLYCDELLPPPVFERILKYMIPKDPAVMSFPPTEIPQFVQMAIERSMVIPLKIPANLVGKPIWVPVAQCKVIGATTLQTKDGWAQIKPTGGVVKLVSPPP